MKKAKQKMVPVSSRGVVNYRDVKIKKFNGRAKVDHCEKWVAKLLGLKSEAVQLVLPSGRRANRKISLTKLRKNWE